MAAVSANAQINSKEDCKASVDMISTLPTHITDRILACLPLKDAVRTSILSKHWRYKWAFLPQLILDVPFFDSLVGSITCPCYAPDCYVDDAWEEDVDEFSTGDFQKFEQCEFSDEFYGYSKVVNNILLCHVGPIHKFSLEVPHWFSEEVDITPWIQFLSHKFVKELTLSAEFSENKHPPSCIFSSVGFNRLTHLTFENWDFLSLPAMIGGFPFLVSLQLSTGYCIGNATGEVDKLGILVSRCPLLETLRLAIYEKESSLRIHAPRLQNMVIRGQLSSICLEETKEIKTLSLYTSWEQKMDVMMEFFSCLRHVEKVDLSSYFWSSKCLTEVGPPKMLKSSCVLRQLKHLVLGTVKFCQFTISFIVSLFQMAPQLQRFEIEAWSSSQPCPENTIVEKDCCLHKLKFAELHCGMNTARVMLQLIKLILSSSPVLEVMTIESGSLSVEQKLNIAKGLLRYQRAAANAEIIFNT